MCKDVAAAFPAAADVWTRVDGALGFSLSTLAFEGPAEELTNTNNAQPALLAHGAAVWAVMAKAFAPHLKGAAGHSLGEFTAYCAAGALTVEDAAVLVRRRGDLMLQSGIERPGAMAAILGALQRPLDEICAEASADGIVVPANYNTAEQIVISGEVAGVDKAMELAKAAGAKRALKLNVSGAFHSPLMVSAAGGLESALATPNWAEPTWPVYSNVTAEPVTSSTTARALLLRQLSSPVRWVELVAAMATAHPGALFVEMGPGNVLTGLIKRLAPDCTTAPCGTVAELDALLTQFA